MRIAPYPLGKSDSCFIFLNTVDYIKHPIRTTAYDVLRFQTCCLTSGPLATAVLASCTFPGMFQPVLLNGWPHIDGGVWDHCGLMALPLPEQIEVIDENTTAQKPVSPTRLIVNVVFGSSSLRYSKLPNTPKYKNCKVCFLYSFYGHCYNAFIYLLASLASLYRCGEYPPSGPLHDGHNGAQGL